VRHAYQYSSGCCKLKPDGKGQVHEKLDIDGKKLSLLHSYLITIFRYVIL